MSTTLAGGVLTAIVLVHGGFVDGSGWEDVYKTLKKDGYKVSIVQNADEPGWQIPRQATVHVTGPAVPVRCAIAAQIYQDRTRDRLHIRHASRGLLLKYRGEVREHFTIPSP